MSEGITVIKQSRESSSRGFIGMIKEKLENCEPGDCIIVDRSMFSRVKPESVRTMIGRLAGSYEIKISVSVTEKEYKIYIG
jgi:hypothetical protein